MSESSPRPRGEQGRREWTPADVLSAVRLPLAVAFPLASSDLLDGQLARRYGGSALGAVLDPVADKLFMASAFGVVAFSRRLELYEVLGVLLRDLVAAGAFLATLLSRRPRAMPARASGKAVTVAQVLTLVAFLLHSPLLRPMAWATAAIALYAIWDYCQAASAGGPAGEGNRA